MKGFDAHTASLAGAKSAQARRTMKVYKEQHRAAMIDKAESLVADFMDGKAVLGINLNDETRAKIIENVLTEVTIQSLIGALKHRDEVELMLLKHELTINPDAGNTIEGESGSGSDEKPVMLTNTELMSMLGTRYETNNAKPEEDDELFFDWYKSQSGTQQKSILQKYFNNDEEELINFAGRPAASVIKQLRINNG
ncbi:hypothetical protein [Shewanella sp. M-Br]|uniref:hypothetical protein n=1 Tax=Shewanella sp. M-Br TaxID=2495595 RepID=UPI0029499318|nr:hypothetical protein SMBr_43450 [Shewanella sp. M-Br]